MIKNIRIVSQALLSLYQPF